MKIKPGFVLRPLLGEFIVTGEGIERVNFNKIVSLNSSAAYLWESVVGKDFSIEDLRDLLLEKYEVSEEVAARDAASIAASWVTAGVAE